MTIRKMRISSLIAVIGLLAALSCTKEMPEGPGTGPETESYTLSVTAGKDGMDTKALSLVEGVIHATWAEGDQVTAYNVTRGTDLGGCLVAQTAGASTTLKGTLTGDIQAEDVLTLKFLSPYYASQDGTLTGRATSIDKVCDYATASVTVKTVDGSNNITIKEESADFKNQQAIVKFVLYNDRDATPNPKKTNASRLTVKVGDGVPYFLQPDDYSNEFYVALPGFSSQIVYLVAHEFGVLRTFVKSGVSFENGQYYEVSVEVTPHTFSSGSEESAYFSQGNLVYDGSKWYFHGNQYDRVNPGGDYVTSYPMDLFCWGNVPNPAYDGDTYVEGMAYLDDSTDWGEGNDIVNGGGTQRYWRAPWQEELSYILSTRTNAADKYALGCVAGVNGMILLPDDYAGPLLNTSHNAWSNNTISASSWVCHEAYGAVFLPTAGHRNGANIQQVDSDGQYWTATTVNVKDFRDEDHDGSYYLNIDATYGFLWMKVFSRGEGRSVRLISSAN